jgi:classical protein kinase C alpha type
MGSGERDAMDVMEHAFFQQIDWELLKSGKGAVPWVPDINNSLDSKHFDREFTGMNPAVSPDVRDAYFGGSMDKTFAGFSFVDESAHAAMMMPGAQAGSSAGVGSSGRRSSWNARKL